MTRLLVVASTFPGVEGDGTPGFVSDLAAYAAGTFETMVVVPRVPGAPRREHRDGLHIHRFGYFFRRWERLAHGAIIENLRSNRSALLQVVPFLVAEAWAVRRAVRQFRPDVLHVHWIVPQGLVALVAAPRVPTLVTTLGGDVYALTGPLWRRVQRAVVRRARVVTVMNDDMRTRLVALGADPATTFVVPMGADVTRVRAAGAGVTRVPGRLLVVGRLVEKKGVRVVLEALRSLPAGHDVSLDVVGDGPLREELERAARGLPVRFRGQLGRDELTRVLHEAEVAVFASVTAASGDQDGLPVALVEAMAAGCAVVASQLPGIDDAVEDGRSGVLVAPGDPGALATAITALLDNPARRAELGDAAARRAVDFSVEAQGRRYVELLLAAAEGRPPTPPR